MPKKTKPRKETWRDWQAENAPPPGQLIDRDELVQVLEQEGIEATENDLLYWQRLGVIPYPVLRRVGRTGHASYPFWMVELIRTLRAMQSEGHTLDEIGGELRKLARKVSALEQWRPSYAKSFLQLHIARYAINIARTYQDVKGRSVKQVEIFVHPVEGESDGWGVPISSDLLAQREEPFPDDN